MRDGLKQVHIGEDIWLCGRQKRVKDNRLHCVIYGPDRKEYHLYDTDVLKLYANDSDGFGSNVNRQGNKAENGKLKIYIITHILDNCENWCFDLKNIPHSGNLKVIFDNGTVKNIDFDGIFSSIVIESQEYKIKRKVMPIAYRLKNKNQ